MKTGKLKIFEMVGRFSEFEIKDRYIPITIVSIMVLSFLLRIYKLANESIWKNEIFSIEMSRLSLPQIVIETAKDTHPPLYYFILKYWMQLFGESEFSTRFLSLIFGLISIYIIYRLGTLIFDNKMGKEIGIISSFILSISLFHIRYSQEVRFYILMFLLILISNFYFIKLTKNNKNKKDIFGYIISTTALIYTHYYGIIYLIFQNAYYILIIKRNIKFWILINVVIFLIISPWLPFLVGQVGRNLGSDTSQCRICYIKEPNLKDIYYLFQSFSGSDISLYIIVVIISISILYNILRGRQGRQQQKDIDKDIRQDYNEQIFLIMWLFLPILIGFFISYTIRPLIETRYFIASLPAFILLFSKSIADFKKLPIIYILLAIFTLSMIPSLGQYYSTPQKEQWKELVNYMNTKTDKEPILIYNTLDLESFEYYNKSSKNIIKINNIKDLDNYIKKNKGVWLILSSIAEMDPKTKIIIKELFKNYRYEHIKRFFGIDLYYF